MNNEFNQNTRTLIVSFVFALMVMIPLRFVEVNNNYVKPVVLGVSTDVYTPKIEEPYFTIEQQSQQCLSDEEVDNAIKLLDIQVNLDEIIKLELRRCK